MKYNLENKTNRFSQRTLKAFSDTLFQLLQEKSFEEITVNELCMISNYPRATFYNYFEDIYDLLNYCWYSFSKEIQLDDYHKIKPENRLDELFNRVYDFIDSKREILNPIIKINSSDGALITSFQKYLRGQVRTVIKNCPCDPPHLISSDLIADHYSNTLLMMIEWSFLKKEHYSKEQARTCLKYLLGNL